MRVLQPRRQFQYAVIRNPRQIEPGIERSLRRPRGFGESRRGDRDGDRDQASEPAWVMKLSDVRRVSRGVSP